LEFSRLKRHPAVENKDKLIGNSSGSSVPPDSGGGNPETLPSSGFVLLAVLSLFWGLNWPVMKMALSEIPPWTFRTLCVGLGGLGLLFLAKVSGLSLAIPRGEFKPLLLVSLLNVTGWHIFSAHGLVYMKAGRASIIAFTMPLWAAILGSVILAEKMTSRRLLGLFFGIAGLAFLIGPDIKALGSAPLGAVFMLAAAISWACGTVTVKYFRWKMSTALLTGWQMILGGVPVIIGAMILEPATVIFHLSSQSKLALAYVILLPIIFCQWAWFKVVGLFPATLAAIGTLSIPVIGVFSSAMVLGESIGFQELTALGLVVIALAIVMISPGGTRRH